MSPRLRRRLVRLGAAGVGLAALGLLVTAFALPHAHGRANFNVIAIESRTPAATTDADVTAELSQVEANGGQLLLTAIANQTAAPALDVSMGCPGDLDPISCDQVRQRQTSRAQAVAFRLSSALHPAQVDLYALFAQIAAYLAEAGSGKTESVNVFVNTLGDADIPQDLADADLSNATTIASLTRQATTEGAFPGSGGCAGWKVHMVVPASANPLHDLGLRELFSQLISGCDGKLVTWTPRWLAASNASLVLPAIPGVHMPTEAQTQPTFSFPDTFFNVGSATVNPAGDLALVQVAAQILARYPGEQLTCAGSADGTGGSSPTVLALDREISQARGTAVCDQLVTDGVPGALTHVVGLGQTTMVPDPSQRDVRIILDDPAAS
jgi:outer membrane protein OmpA-like peptidoglycan-associated protein